MASRRPYGAGMSAAGGAISGLSDAVASIFGQRDKDEAAARIEARQRETQDHGEAVKLLQQLQDGKADPQDFMPDAAPLKLARKLGINLDKIGPSQDERMAGAIHDIGADTTDSQIQGLLAKNKVNAGLNFSTTPPEPPSSISLGLPPPVKPQTLTPEGPQAVPEPIKRALAARNEAKAALEQKLSREATQAGAVEGAKKGAEIDATQEPNRVDKMLGIDKHKAFNTRAGTLAADYDPTNIQGAKDLANANASGSAAGQFDATHTPDRMFTAVKFGAQKEGANEAAKFPWQQKLAQTRADTSVLNQQRMVDYRNQHPADTADMRNQRYSASSAISLINEVRDLGNEMDKRGMMGPLKGRAEDIAARKIKSEDLFKNPDDAKLAARYFSEMDLLGKLAAKVHGGTRAAASPQMSEQFAKIISGIGDSSLTNGQLDAVESVMRMYEKDPSAQRIPIPGSTTAPGPSQTPKRDAAPPAAPGAAPPTSTPTTTPASTGSSGVESATDKLRRLRGGQ